MNNFFSMDYNPLIGLVYLAALAIFGYAMFNAVIPSIHEWEAVNNYPAGRLCDLYNK